MYTVRTFKKLRDSLALFATTFIDVFTHIVFGEFLIMQDEEEFITLSLVFIEYSHSVTHTVFSPLCSIHIAFL